VSDCGQVANDVEVEQIVHDEAGGGEEGALASYVQMRGSIPTYWSQETSMTAPKPPIVISRVDPTYRATEKHFADLFNRYASPICVLNLVKQRERRPRESVVGEDFRRAVEYVNGTLPWEHK
ncbi:hypothetical protein VYU27_010799, partial [Nannochloropsis oceanica]